jgi:hypothetical protein
VGGSYRARPTDVGDLQAGTARFIGLSAIDIAPGFSVGGLATMVPGTPTLLLVLIALGGFGHARRHRAI